jgi:hypothetical protein
VSARQRTGWLALAAGLLVVAGGCLVLLRGEHAPAEPALEGSADSTPAPRVAPGADLPARPVALDIPAIDVRTHLGRLGMNADGTVEVPANPGRAGWFRLGTRPGARGSAVILGHVDSTEGPGVFYRLSELERGDRVRVGLADGSASWFRVRSVTTYPNAAFPADKVYAAPRGRILNLVTCGGEYVADLGGYQANVVVETVLAGPSGERAAKAR